ncbi:MAG: aminotransferase class I/II-fold pyridoxal phosphate-dependent enzyme [Saprospiraceae bacterium]|nr:aminotransferase class I/II-fold pyridoxal phosphate-dependent enzyme [Saprospiraceae bacterium]
MNISPSLRIGTVEEYYFSSKLKQIAGMRAEGADIINLGIGSPDLPPHPEVIETLYQWALKPDTHGYQSYQGRPELRQAFAQWYLKYFKVALDPDKEILPLIGSKEGIMHISMAFLNPGDLVLIPDPGYPTYSAATKLAGAKPVSYDLLPQNNWQLDLDSLRHIEKDEIKLMWINFPHMPTGQTTNMEFLKKLLTWARDRNILVCNDNPYSFILNQNYVSLLAVPGAKDQAIELNSMSKAQNMAGWRVGVAISNPDFINHIIRFKSNMDSGMFLPVQMAAVKALQLDESWYNQLNETYEERKEAACQIMDALGCSYTRDQQGMFIWAKVPQGDGFSWSDKILNNTHVFITPGGIFGKNGIPYLRISLSTKVDTMQKALARIINHKWVEG